MAAKKKPVSPTPPKKKTASAADFRMKEEADKAKIVAASKNRTDAKGRSGMGADDGFRTPTKGSVGGNLHNELRSIVVGGPIIKTVIGRIASSAAPTVARGTLTGSGSYTTSNPSVASRYSFASPSSLMGKSPSSLMGKGSYSGGANVAGSYSSIRGINAAGKTVLQEDLGAAILAGKVIASKKKKK
jgi:hypothetical protein